MNIAVTVKEIREQVSGWRKQGLSVGLVPTMGYLHEGHKSLITRAVSENDKARRRSRRSSPRSATAPRLPTSPTQRGRRQSWAAPRPRRRRWRRSV